MQWRSNSMIFYALISILVGNTRARVIENRQNTAANKAIKVSCSFFFIIRSPSLCYRKIVALMLRKVNDFLIMILVRLRCSGNYEFVYQPYQERKPLR